MSHDTKIPAILCLPEEIQFSICTYLPATTLISLSQTCRHFSRLCLDDSLWSGLVQQNVAYKLPTHCPSSPSWHDAFIQLYPFWFLARQRIWISNHEISGGLVVAQYLVSTNHIELWHLSVRNSCDDTDRLSTQQLWRRDQSVLIKDFEPIVRTFKEVFPDAAPLLRIPNSSNIVRRDGHLMRMRSSDLQPARDLPAHAIDPGTVVWPPQTIPAPGRTRNMSINNYYSVGHRPQKTSEISQNVFRVSQVASWHRLGADGSFSRRHDLMETWGTLTKEEYTPTPQKPLRGIWVGDYNGHGAEFIAFLQPDKAQMPQQALQEIKRVRGCDFYTFSDDEVDAMDEERFHGEKLRGPLLAVKITGDINVPRGEYAFIASDLGANATLRVSEEDPFRGVRVVRAVGHTAGIMMAGGKIFPCYAIYN
jgi:hypothetical protein